MVAKFFFLDEVSSVWSILANISAVALFNVFSFCWIADELLASRGGLWSMDLCMCACFWRHTGRRWCEVRVLQVATLSFYGSLCKRDLVHFSDLAKYSLSLKNFCFDSLKTECNIGPPLWRAESVNAPAKCTSLLPPTKLLVSHGMFWTGSHRCCGFWNRLGPLSAWLLGRHDGGNLTRSSVKNLWCLICLKWGARWRSG